MLKTNVTTNQFIKKKKNVFFNYLGVIFCVSLVVYARFPKIFLFATIVEVVEKVK